MDEGVEHDRNRFQALPEGAAVSGYIIRRVLGRGGFGITYEAHNPVTNRDAAIKEFFPAGMVWRDGQSRLIYSNKHTDTVEWALRKFRETTTILCNLEHPNIVEVYDYVPANDTGYMIMELLHGKTLQSWLRERGGPPSLDELRPLVEPVIDALGYVHGCGLIHRDIAPDNILIVRDGRPVLIDFGSASRDLSDAKNKDYSGTVPISKRHYTAPEQMQAKAKPTPEADIYSMGAVLYYALSGGEPTDGLERALNKADPYEPLMIRRPPGCPERTASAIDKALALRPEARLRSMAALRENLEELASAKPPPPVPEMRVEETTSSSGRKPQLTRRWVLGIGGSLVAAGAAEILVTTGRHREDHPSTEVEPQADAARQPDKGTGDRPADQPGPAERQAPGDAARKAARLPGADPANQVVLTTKYGKTVIQLRPDLAPKAVKQMETLTRQGFYNGLKFHRVIDGFMAQTGDPTGTGSSGSKLPDLPAEFSDAPFQRGTVGMARTQDPNSANSQFFICFAPSPFLDKQYTVVGQVVSGMSNIDKVKRGASDSGTVTNPDTIVSMKMAK